MQVQSLGWEDPLEKEMVTPSSVLAWRILWTDEPGGPRSHSHHSALCLHSPLQREPALKPLLDCYLQ